MSNETYEEKLRAVMAVRDELLRIVANQRAEIADVRAEIARTQDMLNTIRWLMREREQWERALGIKRDDDEKPKPTPTLQ
jgi:hypothetical protein